MGRRRVSFQVYGIAQPKGSTRAFIPKGWNRAITTAANPKGAGWQQLVAAGAQSVRFTGEGDNFLWGPVVLMVQFNLPRPKSLARRVLHHVRKPDLDKLVRCVKDGLTGVLYQDDSQVVDIHARKVYTHGQASASITVEEADPQPGNVTIACWVL